MKGLWQEIRYGVRMLTKYVSFAVIAVLTLAVGVGANSGIFSVMRQVTLQRFPVPHAEELVLLYAPGPTTGHILPTKVMGQSPFPIRGTQTCETGAPF